MEAIRPLRDRTQTTRLMILARLEADASATLSQVAGQLGITVQAVSAHAKRMAERGWLQVHDGSYRPTTRGLQALHEGVRQLRDAIGLLADPLDVLQMVSAVAAQPVRAGEPVGLHMADGDLEARPGANAPSRGRARNDAAPGEEVIVGELQGLVKLEPGRLTIVSIPAPGEGGLARLDRPRLAKRLASLRYARVGAHGTGARILARALVGEAWPRVDFEFAADRAAFNAAERGLDALLVVSRDRLGEVMHAFERLNAETIRRVPIEQVEAPQRHA